MMYGLGKRCEMLKKFGISLRTFFCFNCHKISLIAPTNIHNNTNTINA